MTLEEVLEAMLEAERAGKMTVRLHTGDPCVYGAIREQMDLLDEAGVAYDVPWGQLLLRRRICPQPGIHPAGGEPERDHHPYGGKNPVPERESIESFAAHGASMAIFLSTGMLEELSSRLIAEDMQKTPRRPLSIARPPGPTKKTCVCTVGTLAETAREAGITKTALILVGQAVAHRRLTGRSCTTPPLPRASGKRSNERLDCGLYPPGANLAAYLKRTLPGARAFSMAKVCGPGRDRACRAVGGLAPHGLGAGGGPGVCGGGGDCGALHCAPFAKQDHRSCRGGGG